MSTPGGFKFPTPKAFDGKPDEFSGASRAREFVSKCELYFTFYTKEFSTDDMKVKFVLFLCEDAAYAWAAAYIGAISDTSSPLYGTTQKWDDFKKAFLAQFSSVDQVQTATRQLTQLKQIGKVSAYAARFRELACQTKWNDESKLAVYYNGLRNAVKDVIAKTANIPTKYEEYVNWTIGIGDRIDMNTAERARTAKPSSDSKEYSSDPDDDAMSPIVRMGLNFGLSLEEIETYMEEKRCFKCHELGHRANDKNYHPKIKFETNDDQASDEQLALEATRDQTRGLRWSEYEDVILPSTLPFSRQ